MALDETPTVLDSGHITVDHAALKAEWDANGWSPALPALTLPYSPTQHAAVHSALHAKHNALGAQTALPETLSTGATGHLAHHAALHKAYNLRNGTPAGLLLDFDFDASETQAFTHGASSFAVGSAHQHAWITNRTRLGAGHAERFEIHNNAGTDTAGNMRSLMSVVDTNDGGVTNGSVIGYPEVYWAWSSYLPTSPDADATVISTFSQTTSPDYEHLFEIHERGNVNGGTNGINNINEVSNLAVMVRDGQLQFRGRCGTWTWNGSSWNSPSWNTTTPGTNGSNDQIPIPIVKSGGTNAAIVMDAWIDIIFHARYRTDSTGLIEIWARQAGQTFDTSPNLTINGPTHKSVVGSDSVTRTSAEYEAANLVTGCYLETGLYIGSTSWGDGSNGAHVHILDELRRWSTIAEAKNNWG